jgi:hypothetical protein
MNALGETRQYWVLSSGMARALGVNLAAAVQDGLLSTTDYARVLDNCRRCPDTCSCAGLLADPAGAGRLARCRNRPLFDALAAI